ncbi:MAG: insulinase family protein [Ignavibacteriae bacterium]|nr:MAG: insulinase family protein [Ignavibacteriota bacterium]
MTQRLTLPIAMLLACAVFFVNAAADTLDIRKMPTALPGTDFTFPKYDEFTLPNGLHVYVVENHDVPTITFSLAIKGGDAYDPMGKEGTAAIMGDMMQKGTKNRTAAQTAEALDGVGASISMQTFGESSAINGSALKKHAALLFTILGEQLTEPVFDGGEFEKLQKQYLASVANQRSNAAELAQALSRKVVYGMTNPLARRQTEGSVKAVERDDIEEFFKQWIRPNNASIAVVGDVTMKEVKEMLNKYLKNWKKGELPAVNMPDISTEKAGVYFVPRKGSVQSSIIVCAAAPSVKDPQWLSLDLAAGYFGSGFGSILFETLRETYSYTYSPFAAVTGGGRYNRFISGSEVRSSVTDSALRVILSELRKLGTEGPDETKLARRKAFEIGQYRMSFERASNVASYLQNAWVTGKPLDMVKNYIPQFEALDYGDVVDVARKYLDMFKLRIIVVGSPDVRSKLEEFGPIYEYTLDLEPVGGTGYEEVDMTAKQIVDAYVTSIGGAQAVGAVKTVKMTGTAGLEMQGRNMTGKATRKLMVGNKEWADIDLQMIKQTQWTDGTQAWVTMQGGPAGNLSKEETERLVADAMIFPATALTSSDYKASVLGKKNGQIYVDAKNKFGRNETYVFNAETMLLDRIEKEEESPQGPIVTVEKLENYTAVAGVKFPTKVTQTSAILTMVFTWDVKVNEGVTDADFAAPAASGK